MDPSLPTEIMDDVLSRLPVKSVIRFRRVSKSWKKQLSCPYFVDNHLKKNKYGPKRIMVTPEKMFSFDEGGKPCHEQGVGVSKVKWYDIVWGSCDGLVCIGRYGCWVNLSLWNPSTGKCKNIGDLSLVFVPGTVCHVVYGFGYDAATNDYQVVGIQFCVNDIFGALPSRVIIYSLRSNTWRTLQDKINYSVRSDQKGTLVNGSLHWIAARTREEQGLYPSEYNIIIAFDISREKFSEVPHRNHQIGINDTIHLTELDGKLGAVYHYNTRFELWVMKSYGDIESWSMLFNIVDNHPTNDLKLYDSVPMYFLNDSQALMISRRRNLFLYDLKAQTAIPVEEFQSPLPQENLYGAISYVESLVALD